LDGGPVGCGESVLDEGLYCMKDYYWLEGLYWMWACSGLYWIVLIIGQRLCKGNGLVLTKQLFLAREFRFDMIFLKFEFY
jgi:hypothetical protein